MASGQSGRLVRLLIAVSLVVAGLSVSSAAQTEKPKAEQFSATVYPQAGLFAGRTTDINIYVNGYTPDDEATQLRELLRTKGSDAVLSAVEKMKEKGRVAVVGTTGWGIPVIRQHPTNDGGRRLVFFGNRPLSFFEVRNDTRSRDYAFGLMILNVNGQGQGDGLLYPACKVRFNKQGELEVENFGIAPAKVVNVRMAK
jgi:hypothetical protein